ncbi:hypothetical protein ACOME3_006658 [Neoechinorhynchus agilis]
MISFFNRRRSDDSGKQCCLRDYLFSMRSSTDQRCAHWKRIELRRDLHGSNTTQVPLRHQGTKRKMKSETGRRREDKANNRTCFCVEPNRRIAFIVDLLQLPSRLWMLWGESLDFFNP